MEQSTTPLIECMEQDPKGRPEAWEVLANLEHIRATVRESQSGGGPPGSPSPASLATMSASRRLGAGSSFAAQAGALFSAEECLNLRFRSALPSGRVLYIQSGDPGDFNGKIMYC